MPIFSLLPHKLTIITIAVVGVIAYILHLSVELKQSRAAANDYKELVLSASNTAKRYIDFRGKEHLKQEVTVIEDSRHLKQDSLIMALTSDITKLKNLKMAQSTIVENRTNVITTLRDSVTITRDTLRDCVKWTDGYSTMTGCFSDTVRLVIRDTINQVVYVERKKFLFFRWGTKNISSDLTTKNPNNHIVSGRVILIKK